MSLPYLKFSEPLSEIHLFFYLVLSWGLIMWKPGTKVIKLISCSAQLNVNSSNVHSYILTMFTLMSTFHNVHDTQPRSAKNHIWYQNVCLLLDDVVYFCTIIILSILLLTLLSNLSSCHHSSATFHIYSNALFDNWDVTGENLSSGFQTKWDLNQPAQLQRLARKLKFRLLQVWMWCFPKSEKRRRWSDCVDAQAGLRPCSQTSEDRFSRDGAQLMEASSANV